ncbi:MAG: OMP85 family outer membrane protein [uncultured bacterium]|nr:MAG: OMP85 family outer membrane protein [uncultured bacterium]HBH18637.1 hypothetical protein [Cyanobacteria bacterium UBA9579]
MRKPLLKLAIASALVLISNTNGALKAEIMPPSNVDPGVIDSARMQTFDLKTQKPKSEIQEEITKASESAESPAVLRDTKFQLNKVIFTGNTQYKSEDLTKFAADIIGKEVTFKEVNAVARQITNLYRENGYLTSLAYITPQTIEDGIVEISIVEGKIGDIEIQGTRWTKDVYLKNTIFKSNGFDEDKIFNINSVRKSLNDLNQSGYLKGQIILEKGEKAETTDIILDIKERMPFSLGVSWDNLGRDLIGNQRANITVADNNLTGFGDRLYAGTSLASGAFGVSTGYEVPVGPYGTKFRFGYSFADIDLGGAYKQYKIDGNSHLFGTSIIQPIYKGGNFELVSDLGFDMRHSKTTLLGDTTLQNYNLRVLRTGLNAIKYDNSGKWISRAEVSTGLPILGATTESGHGIGSSKFVKINSNLIRVQKLPFNSLGIARVSGQFSPNALLAPEQTQLGGSYTVRGYDEGILLGDLGYNASLEVRTPIPFLPASISLPLMPQKIKNINLKDKIQFAAFYDQGYAKMLHQNSIKTSGFLQSVGVGLRCSVTRFLSANLDLGVPLGGKVSPDQNAAKFHFSLTSNLF